VSATGRSTADTRKGAARRAAILDNAAAILAADGHAALSLRAVATATGIRLGNLQYYFATRADLVAGLLDRLLEASLDRFRDVLDAGAGPGVDGGPAIGAAVDILLAEQYEPGLAPLFYELWAMAAHDDGVAVSVRGFYHRYTELVAEHMVKNRPGVDGVGAWGRARTFVALLEGTSLFRSGVAGTPDAGADAMVRQLAVALITDSWPGSDTSAPS
jgi:AcrR family transcriptional regulator